VTWFTSPRPPHTSQVSGWVPGAVPSPEQVGQTTAVSTTSSRVAPNAHSERSSSTRTVALRPRRARLRGPREVAPAPKNASMMSLNGNPAPKPAPPPGAPPAGANGSAPRSYICRFSGSESTS
jgi:septal ring-binding cell division protein DamX